VPFNLRGNPAFLFFQPPRNHLSSTPPAFQLFPLILLLSYCLHSVTLRTALTPLEGEIAFYE